MLSAHKEIAQAYYSSVCYTHKRKNDADTGCLLAAAAASTPVSQLPRRRPLLRSHALVSTVHRRPMLQLSLLLPDPAIHHRKMVVYAAAAAEKLVHGRMGAQPVLLFPTIARGRQPLHMTWSHFARTNESSEAKIQSSRNNSITRYTRKFRSQASE